MGNKFTSDDFFRKAKEIWKDEYDYSNVVYKDYETEVKIICKKDEHPEYLKKPKYHLNQKLNEELLGDKNAKTNIER